MKNVYVGKSNQAENVCCLEHPLGKYNKRTLSQEQHGMGPLINMQKSVFLPLWDNHELYSSKILHIEGFSAKESENLVRIAKNSSHERSTHAQPPRMIN